MFFGERVRSPIGVGRDALGSRNVHECAIARAMRLLSNVADCFQFLFRIDEAFITAGDVVIDFDSKDSAFLSVAYDLGCIVISQAVGAYANEVGPVLIDGGWSRSQNRNE